MPHLSSTRQKLLRSLHLTLSSLQYSFIPRSKLTVLAWLSTCPILRLSSYPPTSITSNTLSSMATWKGLGRVAGVSPYHLGPLSSWLHLV